MSTLQRRRKLIIPGSVRDREPGEIVLPGAVGNRRAAGGLTIHVPSGYEKDPPHVVGVCNGCGAVFREKGQEDAWQRHTVRCGQKHLDDIRAIAPSEKRKGTIFDEQTWDPEVEAHMRKVGKRMAREGRMEVLPSERAGFS